MARAGIDKKEWMNYLINKCITIFVYHCKQRKEIAKSRIFLGIAKDIILSGEGGREYQGMITCDIVKGWQGSKLPKNLIMLYLYKP